MILLVLGLAWIAGIAAGACFSVPWLAGLLSLLPLAFVINRNRRRTAVLACLAVLLFVSAAGYSYQLQFNITSGDLRYYNDLGEMRLEGVVVSDPDARDSSTRLEIEVSRMERGGKPVVVEGKALVFVPRYPEYRYGDVLIMIGEPLTPPVLEDFDYRGYLRHQGINTVLYYPSVEVGSGGQGNPVMRWIYSVRHRLSQSLSQTLPEPQASLAQGMLLGIRGSIPESVRQDFNASGTAHLLAISGLHLGIVAGMLLAVGIAMFGRRHGLYIWFALAGIWVYAVMTGLNPPVVRGAVMATMFLAAEGFGRQRSGLIALVFAAAVMAGLEPYIVWDASFQLSFLAMAGLVLICPLLQDAGRWCIVRVTSGEQTPAAAAVIVDTMSATLAATLAVWPVVAYHFGAVSLAGIPATLLALPALAGIIVFSGFAAVAGLAVPVIGQVFGWAAWLFLSWVLLVTGWLGTVPKIMVGTIHPLFIWCYYIAVLVLVWAINRWRRRRNLAAGRAGYMHAGLKLGLVPSGGWKWALVPLLLLAVLLITVAAGMPGDEIHVSFLDVGQGDAILVSQGLTQVLIDGGPGPGSVINRLGERMPFWDRTIEAVMLTHPHSDHLAGLVEVLRRYEVRQVVVPRGSYGSTLYREWQRVIEEKGIPVTVVHDGHRLDIGDISFEVLHPAPDAVQAGDENALVLRLDARGVSFLFAADIPGQVERDLVRDRAVIGVDVLKAAHHGSDESSIEAFLAVVSPQAVVISCGEGNRYGHPGAGALERLESTAGEGMLFRTDEDGSVDFMVKDGKLIVSRRDR